MTPRSALALMCILPAVAYVSCSFDGHGGSGLGFGGGFGHGHEQKDYYARPQYKYSYGVSDAKSGDYKQAYENRDGDNVEGAYSLQEPDGSWRTVNYVSDQGGFRANVHRSGGTAHPNGWGHGNGNGNGYLG